MRTPHTTARALLQVLLGLCLAGCRDFLSTDPKGELTSGNFFATAEHAIQATNATYSQLRKWEVHVFAWIGMTDIASDDANKGSVPGDGGPSYIDDLDDVDWNAANLAVTQTWNGYYQGVYRANVAIAGIPGVPMDAQLKARLIGENKFLRAYYYFFLVRAYGGVPLVTHPLAPSEFIQTRASAQAVYDLIEQDLRDAIAVLPEKSQYEAADMGRATKGAAHALLAQAHLYQKEYSDALQHAQAVINSGEYSLYPDYGTIFTQAGENSSESVFEVQVASNPGSGCQPNEGCSNSQYSQPQGVRGTPNLGWGFNTPSASLVAEYEGGDPREQATILHTWETLPDGSERVVYFNPAWDSQYNQKAFVSDVLTPGGDTFNSGVNIRRIRYADVLLIAAEAAHRTGTDGVALGYLNQVRARARGADTVTLGFTTERLNESIATNVLGLPVGGSRVFVRWVKPGSAPHAAGLRSFTAGCVPGSGCAFATVPPIRVDTVDIIQTVDGSAVTTPEQFHDTLDKKTPPAPVTLGVLRVMQDPGTGAVSTQSLSISIPAQELLPDVTVVGPALLDAIWHERRVELAMEEQRFFDIRRQDIESPGRAAALMAAHGKTWLAQHALYPIPATEVQVAGLQQNPGY